LTIIRKSFFESVNASGDEIEIDFWRKKISKHERKKFFFTKLFFGNFGRQLHTSLGSSTRKHLAATGTLHSFAKALCPQTALLMGLEGSLHV
jgi:hypothetical protein